MQELILIILGTVFLVLLPAVIFRKRGFEVQGVLVLARTRKGLNLLDKLAGKKSAWNFFADVGIIMSLGVAGAILLGRNTGNWKKTIIEYLASLPAILLLVAPFAGNLLILLLTLFFGISFFILAALALNSLMIVQEYMQGTTPSPGVIPIIPGTGNVPLYAVISLLILLVVHEMAHGIVSRAQKISVKSLGILLLGIIPIGAFTEPDEEELKKAKRVRRMRVYAAGSMANFVTAALFFILLLGSTSLITGYSLYGVPAFDGHKSAPFPLVISNNPEKMNYMIQYVENSSPAQQAGLAPGMVIENPGPLFNKSPGEQIVLVVNGREYKITADEEGMVGVMGGIMPAYSRYSLIDWAAVTVLGILAWTFLLNYLVGMVNLLPFWMLDGYKLVEDLLNEFFSKESVRKITLASIAGFVGILFIMNAVPWFIK